MTTGYLASHPPSINIPFINPDGTVNQTWLLFILSVFQRTGGNTSPTYTLAQLEQLVIIGLSVVKANGFNGIVTTGQNSTLTIETTVTGIVKGDGTALSAATAGVDYGTVSSVGVTVPSSLLSVTPSTITSSGTFAISLTTQASNTLLAGPITGVGTAPTFRGLVSNDIPALNYISTLTTQGANQILAGPSSGVGAAPTFRSLTTADIPALPYGTGTVSSVGMTVPSALLSVAPSTITTSGTFALSLTTQTSAQIFASPISTVGTPSFRSLVTSDIPALNYVSSTTTQAAHQVLAGPITGTAAPTFRSLVSTDIPALPYGTGTVTSVALALPSIMSVSGSPVTTTGTLTGTLTTQAANSLFAGPISGVGATPTFRALTTADLAGLGVGTVTSVGMTVPSILSVTPSTITTSGSFALSLTTESANQIFAGPASGSATIPTFRALVSNDIPTLSQYQATLVSGTNIKTVTGNTLLGSGDVGTIGIAYGGTGSTTASGALTSLGASPLAGSASLITLGTVTTGTWNGSTIGVAYGGTGLTSTPLNGQINIGNGTGFTRATLTAGIGVSVTNGSGSISIALKAPSFSAYLNSAQTITAGTFTKVQCATTQFDTNSNYNTSTYRFTPTVAGYYQVNATVNFGTASSQVICSLWRNGGRGNGSLEGQIAGAITAGTSCSASGIMQFNGSTDYLELYAYSGTVNNALNTGTNSCIFSATLISS